MNSVDRKARQCEVVESGPDTYHVLSPSGSEYVVQTFDDGASAHCNCTWGDVHGDSSCEHGCSHMRAVWLFTQGYKPAHQIAIETYNRELAAGYSVEEAARSADAIIGYSEEE